MFRHDKGLLMGSPFQYQPSKANQMYLTLSTS